MIMKGIVLTVLVCISLTACEYNKEVENLKSPCVGLADSPCGAKRPANPHMMEMYRFKA